MHLGHGCIHGRRHTVDWVQGRPARPQTALLRVWRPGEDLQSAQEGDLLWVTRLTPFSRGGCRDRCACATVTCLHPRGMSHHDSCSRRWLSCKLCQLHEVALHMASGTHDYGIAGCWS
jgi:hypothetical protein